MQHADHPAAPIRQQQQFANGTHRQQQPSDINAPNRQQQPNDINAPNRQHQQHPDPYIPRQHNDGYNGWQGYGNGYYYGNGYNNRWIQSPEDTLTSIVTGSMTTTWAALTTAGPAVADKLPRMQTWWSQTAKTYFSNLAPQFQVGPFLYVLFLIIRTTCHLTHSKLAPPPPPCA